MQILKSILAKTNILIVALIFFMIVIIVNNSFSDAHTETISMKEVCANAQKEQKNVLYTYTGNETVVPKNASTNAELFPECLFMLVMNETDHEVIVAKNPHVRIYPASMTKMMTACVVLDAIESGKISLTDMVTIENHYDLTYDDVAPFDMSYGSVISVKDLLYGLMIESNNYYALILADYVAGSEDAFVRMMNDKAKSIGATGTHFENPHGLDEEQHFTSPYDTYLILKELASHDIVREIDSFETYEYTYTNGIGETVDMESVPTNAFLLGEASLPSGFTMLSWKTGTTSAAGNCLAMMVEHQGKQYVLIGSSTESRRALYEAMIRAICMIP